MTIPVKKLTALLLASGTVLACQSSADSSGSNGWTGTLKDLTVRWSAAPDVDLTDGVAVPVRAYFESRFLAQFKGALDAAIPDSPKPYRRTSPMTAPTSAHATADRRSMSLLRPQSSERTDT